VSKYESFPVKINCQCVFRLCLSRPPQYKNTKEFKNINTLKLLNLKFKINKRNAIFNIILY